MTGELLVLDTLVSATVNITSMAIGVEVGVVGSHEVVGSSNSKNYMAKLHQFRLFSVPFITKCN